MARKRHGTPRTLEPEAPSMYGAGGRNEHGEHEAPPTSAKRMRPAAGQKPPTLDEALASVALTVGVRLIERLLAPTPEGDSQRRAAARVVGAAPGVWPAVETMDLRRRACGGSHYLCGERDTLDSWRFCPYCGGELRAVQ